ncbi:MAG: aminotransferase class I/II-fold pyridoxal phosphate-dependent enzyme [Clostridia bacterium]|nr:aminotransferase class I/II-fold pyridoxal phosphate-dependent enzyme [Clostridia bacterium]
MAVNLEQMISPVVKSLPPSGIRKFFDLIAGSPDIISLGVGEPDFSTPMSIRHASIEALYRGETSYTSNKGTPELREELSKHLFSRHQVQYDPEEEILVTIGASEAVDLALRAILCPGDEVIIVEPAYVSYTPCTILAGGKPVFIQTKAENDFKLMPEELEAAITPKTKLLIMAYPNNPTGAIMTKEELKPVAEVIAKHNLLVLSDEIYAEMTYGCEHASIIELPGMRERTILVHGFSKSFAMTGWRIGFAAGPAEILGAMTKIHQYTILCAPIMAQQAALEGLRNGAQEVQNMVQQYNYRRRLVYSRLLEMGLECFEPKGAFYIFPSVASTGFSSEAFAQKLLEEEKVAVVPGEAFGASGKGHIRISYANSVKNLEEAMNRMERFLRRHQLKRIAN